MAFLNVCRQSVKTSFVALLAKKWRSFLTMLGIIIGVGAVILIMALGAGAQSLIVGQVKSLGSDLVGILPGKSEEDGPPASAMGIVITTLTYEDSLAIANPRYVPNAKAVVAYAKGVGSVTWKANSYDTNLSGVSATYLDVEGGSVAEGRFFNATEVDTMAKSVVLGSTVKKELFGVSPAIGQKIKIKNHIFEVIGVMAERGSVAFQDYDDQIFLPLKTMQKQISGVNHLGFIRIKVDTQENIDRLIKDVESLLRDRHNIRDQSGESDDFSVRSAAEALDILSSITDALRFFLAAMAGLSLIVGGIGIMNIMLVSVNERTREIGLRKALGATEADITWQFLLEAVILTFTGGLFGILGGVLLAWLIAVVAVKLGYDWEFLVSWQSVVVAVGVSASVGLVFGLYPARRAAKLEPIEALRYE